MVSSQEDRTGSISWLFRTFTVLSLWGVMGGGYNLCVHNIIHICMYIFLLHIYIYKYNYIIYIYTYIHTSIHAVYHSTTVYHSISTLNLYQMSASSIRTYQGREMPRTLATQAAGRFKSTDSTGSMDSMYTWATESYFEVTAKGGADPTSFSMSWCRFEHWPPCFPTSHLDIFFNRPVIFSKFFNLDYIILFFQVEPPLVVISGIKRKVFPPEGSFFHI